MGEMSKKNKVGRPLKFATADELEAKINEYFKDCPDKRMVKMRDCEGGEFIDYVPCPTVCGLALHLGFVDRRSMYDYNDREEFSHIIKKARTMIEKNYETNLQNGQCSGSIFALKNMGWSDKVEQEHSVKEDTQEAFLKHLKDM